MKLRKIISQILFVAMMMSFVSAFAVIPSNASTSLSSALETLRENIVMLYVKGPAISSKAVQKMRIDGIPSEYDYEGGDYRMFTDRLKFEAYLASVDPYDDYFFTDKTSFINLFGGDVTFIDGYKWYKSVSSAGVSDEDSLIKYNLSNLVMYASDVYAFCTGANDVFPENLDSNMITIVIEANENITKVINALKAQIKSDSDKPNNYRGEYLREYPSETKGVYPYLDKEFNSNNQNKYKTGLIGYIDSSVYTKKTYTYTEIKENSDALSAFETAYNTYKSKSDAGRLYYDYLQDIEPVNEAYAKLCDSLVSSSVSSADLTEKAKAYYKLKNYVDFFDKWIIPNIDSYSNAYIINITTAKWLIGFVRDEACFLNSIALTGDTSLNSLVTHIEEDISKLSALSGSISSNDITEKIDDVSEINEFIAETDGISDSKYSAEFTSLCDNADRISDIESSSFAYPAKTFVSFNGKTIEIPSLTVSFSLIKSAYESLIEVAKYEATDLLFELIFNTPYRLCSEKWNSTFDNTENVDEAFVYYSLKQYYGYSFLENLLSDNENEGLSDQSEAIFKKINGTNNMVDIDSFFKAFVGVEVTKIDEYIETILPYRDDENVYQTLFETALSISEFDTNTYLGYLKTISNSVLGFFNLSSATELTVSKAADGKSPNNDKNYRSDVLSGLFDSCSLINNLTSVSSIEMVIYKDKLDCFVKAALSDEGYQGYEKYCKEVFDGKNPSLANYITNNINSFNFLISARAANSEDEYAYSKLENKIISPLKDIVEKFGKTNYTSDDIINANNIINTINESNNELTWQYCEKVLNNLNSCYTANSTAVSGLNQKLIAAQALTKDSTNTTPYYSMLFNARDIAVSNAKKLLGSQNVTLSQIEYAVENLSLVIDEVNTYEKPSEKEAVSVDKLKAKIAEAQTLLNRCENITSAAITALSTAVTNASISYNENKDSFTETQLNNEVSQLNTAILNVRSSELLDSTLSLAIENATKNVGNYTDYTDDTWKEYANALIDANELAENGASRLEDCQKAFDSLRVAVDKLEKTETARAEEKEQPEQENETETNSISSQNKSVSAENGKSSYLSDAQLFFDNAMSEFMQYMLSNNANNEKVTVWKDSLQKLKSAIDANASETVIVENIVAVQLAKSYLPVSNPDTSDD